MCLVEHLTLLYLCLSDVIPLVCYAQLCPQCSTLFLLLFAVDVCNTYLRLRSVAGIFAHVR